MEVVNAIGRRKAAVARVFVSEGTGVITINKRDLAVYFPSSILQYVVKQPLNKLGVAEKYDIKVNLDGGGFKGQERDSSSANVNIFAYFLAASIQRLVSKLPGLCLRGLLNGRLPCN